ncbi:MAG: extracellular solute-binding protein [Clostridia bacterium]|nr:extracellular solute-binding protein [Clostridia bacterium]
MKKSIFNVLRMGIVVALVFSLAACGSTTKPSKTKTDTQSITLTMWHHWVNEADSTTNSVKNAIKDWNDRNPKVKVLADGVSGEPYKTKIKTALAAGEAPDLFYMWGGSFVSPYISEGNILPLDSYLNDGTRDRLIPGILEACTFDGRVYSLPMLTFIANLYCNKELFEKAGAKIPETYDELLDAVKKLRAKGITPISVGEKDRWPGMYWYDILAMRQAGNQACMDAMKKPSQFDQPQFREAAEKLTELVKEKAFNDNAFGLGFNEMVNEFTEGKAAMIYQGNWVGITIDKSKTTTKDQIVVVPFPVIEGGKGIATEFYGGNVDGFCVNVNTQHVEEAVAALKFICEKAGKEGYLRGAGLPCWKTDGADSIKITPLTKEAGKLMNTGTSFVGWWDTILPAAEAETHKSLVAELFAGKKTPDEFVKDMAKLKGTSN